MDLLEELEDVGRHCPTYLDTQVIENQDERSEEEIAESSEPDSNRSMLGMNFNIGGISKTLEDRLTIGQMPDMNILNKVRERLYGTASNETRNIQEGAIDSAEKEDEEGTTQVLGLPVVLQTEKAHILPQLSIDDAEIRATECVAAHAGEPQEVDGLFAPEDEPEEGRRAALSKEERQLKIAQLAERKRLERMAKEKHREELDADITHTTLTDEENELNEHNESVVTSYVSNKQMKEADEFLNIKKREKIIQPHFNRKVTFTKDRLLSAFDDAENDSEQSDEDRNSQEAVTKSSPVTSPLKDMNKTDPLSNKKDEDNILDLLDTESSPQRTSKQPQRNPIEIYAQNLKLQLHSSPTKSANNKVINLDSDSESVSNSESELKTQRNANNDDLKTIPQLSKEDKLSIKQRFSKKKMSFQTPVFTSLPRLLRKVMYLDKAPTSTSFLEHLRKANINQLLSTKLMDPHNELLEELEKDEEVMGSLLEREMERVRNIRRKEKLKEKAVMALSGKGSIDNSDDELNYNRNHSSLDDEVPDSEVDSDLSSNYNLHVEEDQGDEDEDEEDEEEEDEINKLSKTNRKARRLVISDNEDDNATKTTQEESLIKRSDDSYMFGVVDQRDNEDSLGNENDNFITTLNTQKLRDVFGSGISLTQAFENSSQTINQVNNKNIFDELRRDQSLIDRSDVYENEARTNDTESYELFKNLKPREKTNNFDSQASEDINRSSILQTELPSFQDIIEADTQTQPDTVSTQVDNPVLFDASTQIADTQAIQSHSGANKVSSTSSLYKEEDEDVNPSTLKNGRKLIRKNIALNNIPEDDENSDEELSPEQIQKQIKLYEEKIRRKELKSRKKQKELERMGMKNIIEGEAEESEDEWHGLGGVDGDMSDEQANSEDEKMIDNNFNIDLKNEEIRRKFMEEYQIKDQRELEKLLDDIKNHKLTKRVNGNGFDIELSDEEDELLAAYRKQKLKDQRERLLSNKKLHALSKNEKSKAFFDSIQDSSLIVKIDDEEDFHEEGTESPQSHSKNPFASSDKEFNSDKGSDIEDDEEEPKKRTIKVEEAFVQKQLSFLMKSGREDYEQEQKISKRQHGFVSSDDEIDDLQTLKSKSLSNLHCGKRSESPITSDETLNKRSLEGSDTDIDEEFMPNIKKPSIIKSFRLSSCQQGIKVKDGTHFTGVTISKQYKTVSGSKASITYLSKAKRNPVKSLKEKKIERSLNNAKINNTKLFRGGGFEN